PEIFRGNLKPVPRRIVPLVCERHQIDNLAPSIIVAPQQRRAAFVRIRLHAVRMNPLVHRVANLQPEAAHSSLQNRSLKYFSPESGNTVTITARSPFGSRRATCRQAHSAAPALTPTRIPSSRAN